MFCHRHAVNYYKENTQMKHQIELKAMPEFAKTQHLFYSGLSIYVLLILAVIT